MLVQLKATSVHPNPQGIELLDQGERILEYYNSDNGFPELRYTALQILRSAHGI